MIDTRVKYNELNVDQLYYSVICGKISPIIIKSKLEVAICVYVRNGV